MPKGRGLLINDQESYELSASARRVVLVDENGVVLPVTSDGLKVDTELTLDGDVNIDNIQVGSTNGIEANTFLKTDSNGVVEVKLGGIGTNIVGIVNASDVRINPATEETLTSLDDKDFSTETTLSNFSTQNNSDLTTINTTLSNTDFSTETTLIAFKTQNDINLNDIESDVESVDTNLQSFAAQNTLDLQSIEDNQTDKSQFTKITDGTNDALITVNGEIINTDILNKLGYTESLSDNVTVGLGSPSGIISSENYFMSVMENNCPNTYSISISPSSTTDVLQIFRASADNFGGVSVIANLPSDSSYTIDDFEGSVTSDWIESNNQLVVSKNSNQHHEGSYSMKVRVKTSGAGEYISRSFGTPLDLSSYNNISFWLRQQNLNVTWYMAIGDGTNWMDSPTFGSNNTNTWENLIIPFSDFTEGGTGTTDLSNITIIDFHCVTNSSSARNSFFDLLQALFIGSSEELTMELYDFGTTSNPTNISQGTQLTFDDGTTSELVDVDSGAINRYSFIKPRGILNHGNSLIVGNYYGVRLLTDATIELYGSSTQTYSSGKTYSELESSGTLTDTTKSIAFQTFYAPDAYVVGMAGFTNSEPLNTEFDIGIKNYGEDNVNHQIVCGLKPYQETSFLSKFGRPYKLSVGDTFVTVVDKDIGSSVTQLNLFVQMISKPITRYG